MLASKRATKEYLLGNVVGFESNVRLGTRFNISVEDDFIGNEKAPADQLV